MSNMVPFEDKNSFTLKDEIKLCKGRFDGDKKVWMVPPQAIAHLKELSKKITEYIIYLTYLKKNLFFNTTM